MIYDLYTDGACQPNPGKGGWGFILCNDQTEVIRTGREKETTNNRMELTAVLEGMIYFFRHMNVQDVLRINSDSKYLLDGIAIWSDGWSQRGWCKSNGKPVLNLDLWQKIYTLKNGLKLEYCYVKGHSGHSYNDRVDQLAVQAARAIT